MKKIIIYILLQILLMLGTLYSVQIIPVPEIVKAGGIAVSDSKIYISDGAEVKIYSLKSYKFLAKFGKKGEGPQEFMVYPGHGVRIELLRDKIMINSLGKISFFSKKRGFY